jgi:ComF family protein
VFAPPAREAAAHAFQGPLADAVRRFKYGGARHLGSSLGGLLVAAASVYAGQVDAVVPMPLHVRKLRQRGFNPSALLARPVASALSVPLRTRWLARRRATQDQAGLSSEQRQLNVHGAFAARPAPAQTILLIDDVRTTGATLTEAAATLKAHGHDVFTLALAWAPP